MCASYSGWVKWAVSSVNGVWASNASDGQMTPVCVCYSVRAKWAVSFKSVEWASYGQITPFCMCDTVWAKRAVSAAKWSKPSWRVCAMQSEAQLSAHPQLVTNYNCFSSCKSNCDIQYMFFTVSQFDRTNFQAHSLRWRYREERRHQPRVEYYDFPARSWYDHNCIVF